MGRKFEENPQSGEADTEENGDARHGFEDYKPKKEKKKKRTAEENNENQILDSSESKKRKQRRRQQQQQQLEDNQILQVAEQKKEKKKKKKKRSEGESSEVGNGTEEVPKEKEKESDKGLSVENGKQEADGVVVYGNDATLSKYAALKSFLESGLPDEVLECCKNFSRPSPIQSHAWPFLLDGRDFIGIAATGSGHFFVPSSTFYDFYSTGFQARYKNYTYEKDIVIGTPGRLKDLIEAGICQLKEVSFVWMVVSICSVSPLGFVGTKSIVEIWTWTLIVLSILSHDEASLLLVGQARRPFSALSEVVWQGGRPSGGPCFGGYGSWLEVGLVAAEVIYKSRVLGKKGMISSDDLGSICSRYHIPESIELFTPREGVHHDDNICLNEWMFKVGVWILFKFSISELLHVLGVNPIQVSPNSWKIAQSVMWFCEWRKFSVDRHLWVLLLSRKVMLGCVTFAGKLNTKIISNLPDSVSKWKSRLFYARFREKRRGGVRGCLRLGALRERS
ncbi:hypothetical protein ACLOJK_037117 [Asimina triloba]